MRLFYDHLIIDLDLVYAEIEHLEIEDKDKRELVKLVDEITHHTIIDTILQHVHPTHHETFLEKLHQSPHDRTHLSWLKTHQATIEAKITAAAKKLARQLLTDLGTHRH